MLTPQQPHSSERWRTSSHSGPNGACVEVASLTGVPARSGGAWRTSRYSAAVDNCVEVADLATTVAMRDSKHPTLGQLHFPRGEWAVLVSAIRDQEL